MVNDMARLNAISHNLANSSTAGFKKEILVTRPFVEYLGLSRPDQAAVASVVALPTAESVIDHKPGTLKYSGNPLDIAIEDGAYFEVMTEHGPAYTRQGSFRLDAQGRLVTEGGLPVMGSSGELMLSTSQPVIDANGRITEGDREIGSLRLVRFEQPQSLQHIGNGLYQAGPGSALASEGYDKVRQGFIEASNVNSMVEMVKLIETMRHFESSQRVVQGYGDMMDKAIRTLGEF